jgi:hypothetical protein
MALGWLQPEVQTIRDWVRFRGWGSDEVSGVRWMQAVRFMWGHERTAGVSFSFMSLNVILGNCSLNTEGV